jgi:hypothetical protein
MPVIEELSWNSLIHSYKSIITEIRDTYSQINYTARLILKVHENDPSLDPEDIWTAFSEERIENFTQIMMFNEKIEQRKEEEYNLRSTFWKWLEDVIDSVEDSPEANSSEPCPTDFSLICREIQEKYEFVNSVWQEISSLASILDRKVGEVLQNYRESQAEIEKVFGDLSGRFSIFEETLAQIIESGELPYVVPVSSSASKDRTEGDVLLAKKVDSLSQDLSKAQNTTKIALFKLMSSIQGVKVFNL